MTQGQEIIDMVNMLVKLSWKCVLIFKNTFKAFNKMYYLFIIKTA